MTGIAGTIVRSRCAVARVVGMILCAALVMLPGCVSVLPESAPAPVRFALGTASFDRQHDGAPIAASLKVADPSSTRAYDTVKIALMRSPGQLEYLTGGEWADRLPQLVRTAVVRSFENHRRIPNIGDAVSLPGARYTLHTDIRAMHVDTTRGEDKATVKIYAKIMARNGKVVAAQLFERETTLSNLDAREAGIGFDRAMTEIAQNMVLWSFETLAALEQETATD